MLFGTNRSQNGLYATPILKNFQPLFSGYVWINVRKPFLIFCLADFHTQAPSNVVEIRLRSSSARAHFLRWCQLHTSVFHRCECRVVSMCLSCALMVTGKGSVPRCLACRNPGGLGTIGRVVVAVCILRRNRSPDAQIRVFGQGVGNCGFSMSSHRIHSFNVWPKF